MIVAPASPEDLVERVDLIRLDASRRLEPQARAALGQFMTPAPVARILAHMFAAQRSSLRILDPGVGIGSLSAALVSELLARPDHPERIAVTAYEIDPMLTEYLSDTLELCTAASRRCGVDFSWTIEKEDFIASGVDMLQGRLFGKRARRVRLRDPESAVSEDQHGVHNPEAASRNFGGP